MKKLQCLLLFLMFSILPFTIHGESNDIIEIISKKEVKIGEKIHLVIKIPGIEDAKVLWEDMNTTTNAAELVTHEDYYKKNYLCLEVYFRFFESGKFEDFSITIPINDKDGEINYLKTDKHTITVLQVLTNEELENLKQIEDPSKIELKPAKPQEKIKFRLSFFLYVLLILLLIVIIGLVLYYILYKVIMKKGKNLETMETIPPFEKFLIGFEKIKFFKDDEHVVIEKKLSDLTEILKELIYGDYELNAPSETTKELISSLQELRFKQEIIISIKLLFNEIDMIKFANAPIDFDRLQYFKNTIKNLGQEIHSIKIDEIKKQEEQEKNEKKKRGSK